MNRYWPLIALALSAVLAVAAVACGGDGGGATAPQAENTPSVAAAGPTTFDVQMNSGKGPVEVVAFLPQDVTVREGDTVRWTVPDGQLAAGGSVTFLGGEPPLPLAAVIDDVFQFNPAVVAPAGDPSAFDGSSLLSSGIFYPADTFKVVFGQDARPTPASFETTFTRAGSYRYVSLFFPERETGTVTVVAAGAEVPAQSAIDAQRDQQLQAYLAEGEAARAGLAATSTENPDGTKTWTLPMGASTPHTEVWAYATPRLGVGVGDTVRWTNDGQWLHTATFASGETLPPYLQITPQPGGPGIVAVNMRQFTAFPAPQPAPRYGGIGFVNSGAVGPASEWSLTFTATGEFPYFCALHRDFGQVGSITVTE